MRLSRRYIELVEDIAREAEKALSQIGFKHARIETPRKTESRSIDMLAWNPKDERRRVFIKVTLDTNALSSQEYSDLAGASKLTGAKPVVVSEYDRKIDMQDDVIYKRSSIPSVNVKTLKSLLTESKDLYIIARKGDFYVRINGEKLRREREKLGMSLGELAELLGVTRKAVYEYERNTFDVSIECAEKLIELFGEEITRPYSVFSDEEYKEVRVQAADNKVEERVMQLIRKSGGEVYHAKRTFADLFVRKGSMKMIVGIEHKRSAATIEEKAMELEKLTELRDFKKILIVNKEKKRDFEDRKEIVVLTEEEAYKLPSVLACEREEE